jgi:hypothetical protein
MTDAPKGDRTGGANLQASVAATVARADLNLTSVLAGLDAKPGTSFGPPGGSGACGDEKDFGASAEREAGKMP